MTERLLQFIWQFQYYNTGSLSTEEGQLLKIIHQGQFHSNQGPDFINAKVVLDNTTWAGNIELHIRSSDWIRHRHSADKNYNNTILHVVWQHDAVIKHADGSVIPTLQLQHRVPKLMLQHYDVLQQSNHFVPCDRFLPALTELKWGVWKDRLLVERLQRKSAYVLELLQAAQNHWEEVFWWMLARNFGSKINADCFEAVARSLPVATLGRHKNQIHQLEAMLLGQAGLLSRSFTDDYMVMLSKEYQFLQKKYKLVPSAITPNFLRMRPANFPTIRLAQLAMLVHRSSHLFSSVLEAVDVNGLKKYLDVTANDYWHYHYLPDEPTPFKPKQLGQQMAENIIINTIVPVVFSYGVFHKNDALKEKAAVWLTQVQPEENAITKHWKAKGVTNLHAADSQALIELKNNYCTHRRCLSCSVGNSVLKAADGQNKISVVR
ncbi:DUF2851 family protein [Aridibaculum aurantiacum]|uniref:DUF2851 family protein n=1 Tax=Aridibaculum aurantiacum TaxID=2810307 RepID=UPI001A958748|nr:DUF2851 family protein [Aridibaculum aurantiacum]